MIARFLIAVALVAALYGGWLFLFDWNTKYHLKNTLKKVAISVVLAVITLLIFIAASSNISGL
jgi:uncharacterized membrane protein YidH (DUF202 family)